MPKRSGAVLLISSHVVRGSVGNRAMVFALERLGFSVWAVQTVLLPHHPGHGPGERIVPDDRQFAALLQNVIESDRAGKISAVLSGYLASEAQAHAVSHVVEKVKAKRPDAPYLCDPVLGDAGRLYVAENLAAAIRDRLIPLADTATPNAFECAWLAGRAEEQNPDLAVLAASLPPPAVLVTSAPALMRGQIGTLLVTGAETILFEHPMLSTPVKGTGDLLAALFLARKLEGHDWPKAAELALASVFEVVASTAKAGGDELMLSEFQTSLLQPHSPIGVRRMRSERPAPAGR